MTLTDYIGCHNFVMQVPVSKEAFKNGYAVIENISEDTVSFLLDRSLKLSKKYIIRVAPHAKITVPIESYMEFKEQDDMTPELFDGRLILDKVTAESSWLTN